MDDVTRHVRPKCPERNWAAKHTRRVWLVHMMMAKVSKRIDMLGKTITVIPGYLFDRTGRLAVVTI